MAGTPNYIYRRGASPNTRLLSSQRVRVFSFDSDAAAGQYAQIGLIQTWSPSQSRTVDPARGIGHGDHTAELGVGVTDLTATCSILMMYLKDTSQIFGYKGGSSGLIRSLQHHRWPFDVKETIVMPDLLVLTGENTGAGVATDADAGSNIIETIYEACWLTSYNKSFNVTDTIVTQDADMTVTDIYAQPMDDYETELVDAQTSNKLASNLFKFSNG
jgi:hypothetical protein